MKMSTRGRYGTRALLDLALHQDAEPVLLKDIAQRQAIPLTYLEHVITPLVTAGIIRSTRGPRGGISLARPIEEIRLSEVVRLLEGSTAPAECVNDPAVCQRSGACAVQDVWCDVSRAVSKVLEAVTLKELVERQKSKVARQQEMYYI